MFDKRYRLTKRGSFSYVYSKGASKNRGALRITYVKSKGAPKIGISVPNTVGKAVVRNKVRRRIRAALRSRIKHIRPAQIVISARKGAEELSYLQICDALDGLISGVGLYEKKSDGGVGN